MTRFCHLIEDTRPGGVMRMLDFIQSSDRMAALGQHEVIMTPGGLSRPPQITADVIVSHIVLCWRNLPFLFALRAQYPQATLMHIEHHYSPAFAMAELRNPCRFRTMLQASMAVFDHVVAISGAQQAWLRDRIGVASDRLHLIPSCVALDALLDIAPPAPKIRRIGAIGRLGPQKGFDLLIPAFLDAGLKDVTLEVFGDGPDRAKLTALAKGDSRVVFHRHVPDPITALQSVDAVAMPSRREPYGLVALEAMAAGRPILVSAADGLLEHAAVGAMAVREFSVGAWRSAIQKLCATDNTPRAQAARERVRNAEASFAAGWHDLLEHVGAA